MRLSKVIFTGLLAWISELVDNINMTWLLACFCDMFDIGQSNADE